MPQNNKGYINQAQSQNNIERFKAQPIKSAVRYGCSLMTLIQHTSRNFNQNKQEINIYMNTIKEGL